MKIEILSVLLLALLAGIATAALDDGDLTNIDPAVFDSSDFKKDGVSAGSESDMTSSMAAFAKDGNEKNAKIAGMKVALVGSKAKDLYMNYREKQEIPTYAAQVENYLNEQLNRSTDLIVIDELNVTEGSAPQDSLKKNSTEV